MAWLKQLEIQTWNVADFRILQRLWWRWNYFTATNTKVGSYSESNYNTTLHGVVFRNTAVFLENEPVPYTFFAHSFSEDWSEFENSLKVHFLSQLFHICILQHIKTITYRHTQNTLLTLKHRADYKVKLSLCHYQEWMLVMIVSTGKGTVLPRSLSDLPATRPQLRRRKRNTPLHYTSIPILDTRTYRASSQSIQHRS